MPCHAMIKTVKKIPLHLVKDSLSTQTPMPFLIIIVRAVISMKIGSSQVQHSVTACYAQGSAISYLEGSNFLTVQFLLLLNKYIFCCYYRDVKHKEILLIVNRHVVDLCCSLWSFRTNRFHVISI